MDLSEFLLARVAEDEAVARLAKDDGIRAALRAPEFPVGTHLVYGLERAGFGPEYQAHAVTFDPARVLAECEAKRRIVEKSRERPDSKYPNTDDAYADGLEEAVCILAQPFASHPDFDPAWRIS